MQRHVLGNIYAGNYAIYDVIFVFFVMNKFMFDVIFVFPMICVLIRWV